MNLDDASLFLDAMGDVQPLKHHADVHWQPMRNLRTPARIDTLQLDNYLSTGFRQMLFSFILQAQQEGLRNVLVIHGKGRDDNSHANIVRSYVARWLTEFDDVQAYCAALPHHGGSGACYVALRKTAQAKQDNWERHAKRSR